METNDALDVDTIVEADATAPLVVNTEFTEDDQLRMQRIVEYASLAFAKPNPLESSLGSINSGFLKINLILEKNILDIMGSGPLTPERMQRLYRAIDTHLRVAKQIHQFSKDERRSAQRPASGPLATISVDVVENDDPNLSECEAKI